MFAGAAFTDQADIKATDAVNMLSSLGVITGYTDGSYQPNKVVTRAEMAKMIFVVRNNKIDDSAYQSNYSKLTDISNHWAKGYIKFCESQGIIAGKGNNKFDPDSPVTGVEAAKMLLVVSGYDSAKAGLTGSAWRTNVLKYAGAAGILDDVNSALEQGLPRQYAAQMIYNTLNVNRVKWSEDSKSFDDILNGGVKETVGSAYMGLSYDYGTLVEIDNDSLTIKLDADYDSDNYHNADRNYKGGDKVSFTKVGEDYTSLLGQKVKVMFKDGKTNNVLGVYSISDNKVYTTLMNKVELDGSKIKFEGTSYSVDNTKKIDLTFIGVNGTKNETVGISYFDKDAAANADSSNGNTSLSEVTFVDTDGNNKIDTALVIEKVAAEVTNVASDKITFAGKTYKYADEQIDENIKQDDWAVMSANLYKDCKNIVKADVVNATADGYKAKTGYHQYKIDGTWYKVSPETYTDAGISTGDKVKAYVVNGVAVKIDTDDGNGSFPSNIAVAVGIAGGSSLNGDQVRVRYFDGTVKTLTMSDKSDTVGSSDLGKVYKITGSDSDAKLEALTVTSPAKEYNGYKLTQNSGASNATPDSDSIKDVKVDDNAAVILYTTAGRSKLITGKQYKALSNSQVTSSTAVFEKKSNGLNRVQMASVLVGKVDVSGTSSDNYAYIVSDGYENNGDVHFSIWDGSKNVDVIQENGDAAKLKKGTLIGYSTVDSNSKIADVTVYGNIKDTMKDSATATNGKVGEVVKSPATAALNTNSTYIGGNESTDTKFITVNNRKFKITADTTVLRVDSDADNDDEIGQAYTYGTTAMTKAQKVDADHYTENVMFVMNEKVDASDDDKEIAVLVIDSTGAFKGHKVADTNNGTTVTDGTYTSGNASVKVADTTAVTGAVAVYTEATNTMRVQFTLASGKTLDKSKMTVKVDGLTYAEGQDGYSVSGSTGTVTVTLKADKNQKVVIDLTGTGAIA